MFLFLLAACTAKAAADDSDNACVPETEICNDGVDNDCDGDIDCDQLSCTAECM